MPRKNVRVKYEQKTDILKRRVGLVMKERLRKFSVKELGLGRMKQRYN